MNKKELRKKQQKKLKLFLKSPQKAKEDKILINNFLNLNLDNFQNIGVYLSMPFEVDTGLLINKLILLGKQVFIPRCSNNYQMNFTEYNLNTKLTKSKFGVYENKNRMAKVINNLDLMIVPGLAFNISNHQRLGFGAGYYDRFLEQYPTKTISLVNTIQLFNNEVWKPDYHDVPIDHLITLNSERENK